MDLIGRYASMSKGHEGYERPFYFSASEEYANDLANKLHYGEHVVEPYYLSAHNLLEVGNLGILDYSSIQ